MTLIALALYGDHAELVTDDTSYTVTGSSFGRCTKQLLISHLDAALMTQGDGNFGAAAKSTALGMSEFAADFDDFADNAEEWLYQLWHDTETARERTDSTVLLAGYSPRNEEFVAYRYATESEFAQVPIYGLWAMPMPWSLRPSTLEVERMYANPGITDAAKAQMAEMWTSRPELPPPASIGEWVHLAQTIRETRSLETFNKVFVAGNVVHTRLERGASATRRIHTFDDTGDEFNRLVANTHHPQAQVGPCHCGSGQRFIDCHLAPHLDSPCGCGSQTNMRECCSVSASSGRR